MTKSKTEREMDLAEVVAKMSGSATAAGATGKKNSNERLAEFLSDTEKSTEERASQLVIAVSNQGAATLPVIVDIVKRADVGAASGNIEAFCERAARGATTIHRVIRIEERGTVLLVSNGDITTAEVPPHILKNLKRGDTVAVDGMGVVVMVCESIPGVGDIGTVTEMLTSGDECIVDCAGSQTAVSIGEGLSVGKGDTVVFSRKQLSISEVVEKDEEQVEDLTVSASDIECMNLSDIGAIHPILDEMTSRMFAQIENPDWFEKLKMRPTVSYMISGPTGVGKSLHIRALAKRLLDRIKSETGETSSRLVDLSASSLYSPYFGTTEANIERFFSELRKTAEKDIAGKKYPLIVVLDEADALLRSRGESSSSSHLFDRTLSLILSKAQSVTEETACPIIWVTITNRADMVDSAAMRRFGMRSVVFGSLPEEGAEDILSRKIDGMPIEGGKKTTIRNVLNAVYRPAKPTFLQMRLANGEVINVNRSDHFTGAMIEEGVSRAADVCFMRSAEAGELQKVNAEMISESIESQYESLGETVKSNNASSVFPHLIGETDRVVAVAPV